MQIEIPEALLADLRKTTGAATETEAVLQALEACQRHEATKELAEGFGKFSGFISAEELQKMRESD